MQSAFEQNITSIDTGLRNANGNSGTIENYGFDNFAFMVNVSAAVGGGTATMAVEAQDPISSTWFPLLTSAALGVGQVILNVGPAINPIANLAAQAIMPQNYRVSWVIAGTSVTFSISIVSK